MCVITALRLGDCRWPTGLDEAGRHAFTCEQPAAPGRSYCRQLCRDAYRRPTHEERRVVVLPDLQARRAAAKRRWMVAAE